MHSKRNKISDLKKKYGVCCIHLYHIFFCIVFIVFFAMLIVCLSLTLLCVQ